MRVLLAVHALPDAGLGGTELYTQQLAETLAADHEVAVATPRGHGTDVAGAEVVALPDPAEWTDPTGEESGLESGVVHEAVDREFRDTMDAFDPDVVHFQHLKFLSATLPEHCEERGVPSLLTLHDFWTACHREQLYRPSGRRCSGPESVDKCARCYANAIRRYDPADGRRADGGTGPRDDGGTGSGRDPGADAVEAVDGPPGTPRSAVGGDLRETVRERTARLSAAREAVDLLVSPSAFLRERFVSFGTSPRRIAHRRNGIRRDRFVDTGFDPDGPLRVGYAGRITPRKGVHVLVEAIELVEDAELHVFGEFDPADAYHRWLRWLAGDRVSFHGRYEASSTPYELADVLVVPSLWYENSPLVVQEAFASGVPVVTGDAGGMAELVTHGEDGLTFSVGDADDLADRLRTLADSPALVRELRDGVSPPKSIEEHARELVSLYDACRDREPGEVGEAT